ncbi:hypothetical protein [Acinetobacter johnsonii]|uniref:hypothetical protein n=1 Tax=Acinetobacter johnsonii TaxID=40214 RepID=UPI003F556C3D
MFITSFGEQNITYKCCSNFLIHLSMKDWCQKTAFKLVSDPKKESILKSASRNEEKFKTADEEYEEFMKAIVSV